MDYEKKYKEALGWMQSVYPTMTGSVKEDAEHYFPELRESEDERIRKDIISYLKSSTAVSPKTWIAWLEKQEGCEYVKKDWLEHIKQSWYKEGFIDGKYTPKELTINDATTLNELIDFLENGTAKLQHDLTLYANWLKTQFSINEKQGKQKPQGKSALEAANEEKVDNQNCVKPTDKAEPKFHKDEWITNGDYTWKIVEVKSLDYMLQSQDGNIVDDTISHVDEQFHSFTIQDAKDGDVLACESGWTCIFKTLVNDENFSSYCFMDNTKWFCETGSECHTLKEEFVKAYNGKIYPATKEQCDTLMKAMADAGYTFDFENKELKKIEDEEYNGEDYGIDGLWHAQRILEKTLGKVDGYQTDDGILDHKCAITAIKKLYEQKPAEWSEEDEKNLRRAIRATKVVYPETADWLKSLKDRVQPQNNIVTDKELAQAKKDAYNDALDKIEYHSGEPTFDDGWNAAIWYLKKRNDRPQSHWTPSDAQIQALKEACDKSWEPDGLDPLYTLYKDLKKLKGE